jgi:hypothetical protein
MHGRHNIAHNLERIAFGIRRRAMIDRTTKHAEPLPPVDKVPHDAPIIPPTSLLPGFAADPRNDLPEHSKHVLPRRRRSGP